MKQSSLATLGKKIKKTPKIDKMLRECEKFGQINCPDNSENVH